MRPRKLKPLSEAHETYPGIFCRCPDEEAMHRERCPVYQETVRRWVLNHAKYPAGDSRRV